MNEKETPNWTKQREEDAKEARRRQNSLKEPTTEENYRQSKTPAGEKKIENKKEKRKEKGKPTMQILKDVSEEEKGEMPRIGNKKEGKQQNNPQENTTGEE